MFKRSLAGRQLCLLLQGKTHIFVSSYWGWRLIWCLGTIRKKMCLWLPSPLIFLNFWAFIEAHLTSVTLTLTISIEQFILLKQKINKCSLSHSFLSFSSLLFSTFLLFLQTRKLQQIVSDRAKNTAIPTSGLVNASPPNQLLFCFELGVV